MEYFAISKKCLTMQKTLGRTQSLKDNCLRYALSIVCSLLRRIDINRHPEWWHLSSPLAILISTYKLYRHRGSSSVKCKHYLVSVDRAIPMKSSAVDIIKLFVCVPIATTASDGDKKADEWRSDAQNDCDRDRDSSTSRASIIAEFEEKIPTDVVHTQEAAR